MRVTAGRSLGLVSACVLTLAASAPALPGQANALSLSEVLSLQQRGVSARQILRSARDYCIAFTVTDSIGRALAAAGADTMLLSGLRDACVVKPSPPLPPGVLLDDDFKSAGLFAAGDHLCAVRPDARGLRIENRRETGCAIAYPLALDSGDVRLELSVAELAGNARATVVLGFGKDSVSWD